MGNKEAAQEAIRDPNPVIDGRKANVNLAYLGAKPRNAANTLANSAAALAAASKLNAFFQLISLTKKPLFNQIYQFKDTVIHLGNAYPGLQTYG
jgi:hypothetical protein